MPGPDDDVFISWPGDLNVEINTPDSPSVRSLTSTEGITISSGASLSVATASEMASLTVAGGTLSGDGIVTIGGNLTVSGGTFEGPVAVGGDMTTTGFVTTFNGPSATIAGDALISGSFLAGTGDLTVYGLLTWNNGWMCGTGTTYANGGLHITGTPEDRRLGAGRTLVNAGNAIFDQGVLWTDDRSEDMSHDGLVVHLINRGTFEVRDDADIFNANNLTGGQFWNEGIFRKSTGTDTSDFYIQFHNTGTVEVQSGTLNILSYAGTHTGDFLVHDNTTLVTNGSDTFEATSDITGDGNLGFGGLHRGTVAIGGNLTVSGGTFEGPVAVGGDMTTTGFVTTFNGPSATIAGDALISGSFLAGTGDLTVYGLLTWNNGWMCGTGTTYANGGLHITGTPEDRRLGAGRTLVNAGNAIFDQGVLWTDDRSEDMSHDGLVVHLINRGTFEVRDDADIFNANNLTGGQFWNEGIFRKSTGTDTSDFYIQFHNTGTVEVQSGTLNILSYAGTHTGDFLVHDNTTLVTNGSDTFEATSDITGDGNLGFGGLHRGTVAIGGNLTVSGGTFEGPVAVGGDMTTTGFVTTFNGPSATIAGDALISGSFLAGTGDLIVYGLLTWNNGWMCGTGTTYANGGLHITGTPEDRRLGAGRTLVNAGNAIFDQGVLWTDDRSEDMSHDGLVVHLINRGTFEVRDDADIFNANNLTGGQFWNEGIFRKSTGTDTSDFYIQFHNTGTVEVQSGTLGFYGGYDQTGAESVTKLSGGSISSSTPLDIEDGWLMGSGSISGGVLNGGHVSPGFSAGAVEVQTGDYTQVLSGALEIEIGGAVDTEFDRLVVDGSVTLDGALNVRTLDFCPQVGQQFVIIENNGDDANFGTFADLPEGSIVSTGKYEFMISYIGSTGNDVVLTAMSYPPEAALTGPSDGVRGQPRAFVVSAEDAPGDEQAGFTFQIDWGDGMTQTIDPTPGNGAGTTVDHIYTEVGTYTVMMTATDQAGLVSDPVTHSLEITVWAIQPCPSDPLKTALVVGGTVSDDTIVFYPSGGAGDITVKLNGVILGTFHPTCAIMAFAQAGNDDVQVAGTIEVAAWLYGGQGDDRMKGGAGHDVLLGEEGVDLLVGNSGRDILIGGTGADRIVGNADDDILVAGSLVFANLDAALAAIRSEWISDRTYQERIENLTHQQDDGGLWNARANGDYFLIANALDPASDTVHDDGDADVLTGSAGLDWFFFNQPEDLDRATDLKDEVFANDLDWITAQ